jgi:hypothetical protein
VIKTVELRRYKDGGALEVMILDPPIVIEDVAHEFLVRWKDGERSPGILVSEEDLRKMLAEAENMKGVKTGG